MKCRHIWNVKEYKAITTNLNTGGNYEKLLGLKASVLFCSKCLEEVDSSQK